MAVEPLAPAAPTTQTVADLGRLVKRKYPAYARVSDVELGRKVRAKYPAYSRFVDVLTPSDAPAATLAPQPTSPVTPASPRRAIAVLRSQPETQQPAVAGPNSPPEIVRGFRGGLVGQDVEAVGRTLQAASELAPTTMGFLPLEGARSVARRAGGALVRAGQGQAQQAKVPSYKDALRTGSAKDWFDYIQFQTGQAVASSVPSVVAGAAGMMVGGLAGAAVGAGGAAYSLNFGDVAEEVDRALPNASAAERARVSAIITLPVSALDVLPSVRFGGKAAKKLMAQKVLQYAVKSGLLARVLKEGGKGIIFEGGTEGIQEVIQALSVAGASGKPVDADALITRAVDATIGGALAGGTIGGATEAIPQRKGTPPPQRPGQAHRARQAAALAPSPVEEASRIRPTKPFPEQPAAARPGPTVLDKIGARANIEPPRTLNPRLAGAGREAGLELSNTLVQIQQRAMGPIQIDLPGLTVRDAYIVPELVRVFPGDPNSLRVTVVDRTTGRMHSLALPNIGALRSAMSIEGPSQTTPTTATAPQAPAGRVMPPSGTVPVVEPGQVRAASVGAKGRAVARAGEEAVAGAIADEIVGAVPGRIAELKRLVAESPGDKRVKAWKRRIGRLERQIPGRAKPTTSVRKETPAVLAGPAIPIEESKKPAPPPAAPVAAPARPAQPSGPRPTPALSGTEAGGPAAARPRIIVPGHAFSDEATARRIAVGIARSTPDSDAKVVKTKKGYEIEVNEDADASRLKKTPAPVKSLPSRTEVERSAAAAAERRRVEIAAKRATPEPAPEPALATRGVLANVPEGQRKGAAPADRGAPGKEGVQHPPLEMVALADVLGGAANKAIWGRFQKDGATPNDILSALMEAFKGGGGSTSGRLRYTYGTRDSNPWFRFADEKGVSHTVSGFNLEGLVRRGLDIATPGKRPKAVAAPQPELGAETAQDFALTGQKGKAAPSGRSFTEEFEDLARQGRTLEEATADAKARSGSEPPAGLDLEARWSRVRREAQEALGQTDMFGGAALLGGVSQASRPDASAPVNTEREAPPTVSEAAPRAEKPSEPTTVTLEGLWYWQGFQNRDVPRGTPPTQNPGDLVSAAHVRMLSEGRGGFDLDEVVRRPILVWRDVAGELGEKGRRYVIDGHHRAYMAKEAGAKKLPAVEVFGNLSYAQDQARLANMASVPNTFSEQSRIARELRGRGDSWERVAAQLRVGVAKAKAMVDFASLDPGVSATYFPSGNETVMLHGTSHGSIVGRYARESPSLMTVDMQRQWLNQAVNDKTPPTAFADDVLDWHQKMTAAIQGVIDIGGGVQGVRLVMTPAQFAATSKRLTGAIKAHKTYIKSEMASLKSVSARAIAQGNKGALRFTDSQFAVVEKELARLTGAEKEINAAIHESLMSGMRGEKDLATSFDEIQKRVDEIVGPAPPNNPLVGEGGFIRVPDLIEAIQRAINRVSGIARRDPVVKQAKRPGQNPVVQQIVAAMRAAGPVRAEQEALHTEERIKRLKLSKRLEKGKSGMERLHAMLAAQKGPLPKATFESIAKALDADAQRKLADMIHDHPGLSYYDKLHGSTGLIKLLGEAGAEVPQMNELEILEIVFGQEFVDLILSKRPQIMDWKAKAYITINISRALRTAFDLSAPLRQGLFLAPSRPREWVQAVVAMHQYFWTEENAQEGMEEIYQHPLFKFTHIPAERNSEGVVTVRASALSITRPGSRDLISQEEAFLGAEHAERLHTLLPAAADRLEANASFMPNRTGRAAVSALRVAGHILGPSLRVVSSGVRRSNRAYAGFLNKLRFDVFKALWREVKANQRAAVADAVRRGLGAKAVREIAHQYDPVENLELRRDIIKLINTATGRGDSKSIDEHVKGLNAIFFTPKLQASRIGLLNPRTYIKGHPFVRRQYQKSLIRLNMTAATVLTLAGWAGAQVEWDEMNADWGKVRVGNVVFDILGGLAQYVRLYYNLGEAAVAWTQKKEFRHGTPEQILGNFASTKLSPIGAFVQKWLRLWAYDEAGRRKALDYTDLPKDVLRLFVPMVAEDLFEVVKEDPRLLPASIPAANYGAGVQVYPKPKPTRHGRPIRQRTR